MANGLTGLSNVPMKKIRGSQDSHLEEAMVCDCLMAGSLGVMTNVQHTSWLVENMFGSDFINQRLVVCGVLQYALATLQKSVRAFRLQGALAPEAGCVSPHRSLTK